jgi:hypothetical protein
MTFRLIYFWADSLLVDKQALRLNLCFVYLF